MLSYHLAERTRGRPNCQLALCGSAEQRARLRRNLRGLEHVTEHDADGLPPSISLAPGLSPEELSSRDCLLGLLLAQADSERPTINFVRARARPSDWIACCGWLTQPRKALPLTLALLLAAVVLTFAAGAVKNRLYRGAVGQAGAAVSADYEAAKANVAILRRAQKERQPLLDYLLELSALMPKNITLTNLKIDRAGKVTLTGIASSYADAEDLAAQLNASRHFRGAHTARMGAQTGNKVSFSTQCQLTRKRGR